MKRLRNAVLDDTSLDTPVLDEERCDTYSSASQSIALEQLKQKSQYDKKVTGNRCALLVVQSIFILILYISIPGNERLTNGL